MGSHPERFSSITPFINKYNNQEGINYPSNIDDRKTFDKNNPTIALNVLYTKETQICPAYISKINSNNEKIIFLLTITNEKKKDDIILQQKKTIYIIKKNNIKTSLRFLLLELSSFLQSRK